MNSFDTRIHTHPGTPEWEDRLSDFGISAAQKLGVYVDSVGFSNGSSWTTPTIIPGGDAGEVTMDHASKPDAYGVLLRHLGMVRHHDAVNDAVERQAEGWALDTSEPFTAAVEKGRPGLVFNSLSRLLTAHHNIQRLAVPFPGAVPSMQRSAVSLAKPEGVTLDLKNPQDRWALAMQELGNAVMGQGEHQNRLPDLSLFPDWQDTIDACAADLVSGGAMGPVAQTLLDMLSGPEWVEPEASFEEVPTPAEAMGSGAMTEEDFAARITEHSSGVSTPKYATEDEKHARLVITASPGTQAIRDALMDERIERDAGHYSGIMLQPSRLLSDFRPMARRMVVEELPDTFFVLLVDTSGSMGWGGRWETARAVHNGVMKALHDIGIPAISAGYDQQGGGRDRIVPINGPDKRPLSLDVTRPGGGTGDLGAVRWAAEQLNAAGKKGRAVLIVSDNEGSTRPELMKKALRLLGANVVHVDLVGEAGSQYGVDPIVITGGDIPWKTIGQKLKVALNLDV